MIHPRVTTEEEQPLGAVFWPPAEDEEGLTPLVLEGPGLPPAIRFWSPRGLPAPSVCIVGGQQPAQIQRALKLT